MTMTVAPAGMKLIVKHTFLEFVEPEIGERTMRARGLTDSGFFTNGDFSESSVSTSVPTSPTPSVVCDDLESPASDVVDDVEYPWLSPSSSPLWEPRADPIIAPSEFVAPAFELPPWQPILATQFPENDEMSAFHEFQEFPNTSNGGCISLTTTIQSPPGCWFAPADYTRRGAHTKCAKKGGFAVEATKGTCEVPEELRTTVMLRPLPPSFTRNLLVELLDAEGFRGRYDFVYVPVDFNSGSSLGYAFVNLTSPEFARCFWSYFDGFSGWTIPSNNEVCTVTWSDPHQGLAAHVQRYRDSPVMHPEVPEIWKPLIYVNGKRARFPSPTKKLKAPKLRSKCS